MEVTQAFSIVDTDFRQKLTSKMTRCNGRKKVRLHGKKSGKSSSKDTRKRLVKPVGQIVSKHIIITLEIKPRRPVQRKAYDQVNWL